MSDHTVTIEFDRVGISPTLSFECTAGPDAECRQGCPNSECEEGCVAPDEHVTVPLGYCNVCEWLDNTDDVQNCISTLDTAVTVPIEYEWGGVCDGPDWRFAS